jgi:hypothetical protein
MAERLDFLTRRNCHLCELARPTVTELAEALGLALAEFDVDEDPLLQAEFTDRIPVLRYRGRLVAEGRLDRRQIWNSLEAEVGARTAAPDDSVTEADRARIQG